MERTREDTVSLSGRCCFYLLLFFVWGPEGGGGDLRNNESHMFDLFA